jgi:ribosomal protein S18 acetylase RimI-like enzyme
MTLDIVKFTAADTEREIKPLGALMHACVHDGASIGYVLPYSREDGEDFWRAKVIPALGGFGRVMLVAFADGAIAGSVQLDYDTPPNQPHRAEVRKLMVHPEFRRRGIARALMEELENQARQVRRTLLTLDTRTGDAAEPLYVSMGYRIVGILPGWCRDTATERLDPTTFMYKNL